ncbi:MAG: 1,4-alpha-glucan branching protein GlgB [Acidobacteria bacterium]|nr:1,4-alpha-glucan branching protein GlgB [Acidobacteriota bacterium]MBS1866657.1 1,4-alpha-glucan branching protein GlgB [Acidobacteriota bacterium]
MPEKPIPPISLPKTPAATPVDAQLNSSIDALLAARLADPFSLLGPHPVKDGWAVRFFIPWADQANLAFHNSAKVTDAVKLRPEGFFEATWPSSQTTAPEPGSYKIQGRTHEGVPFEVYDPYSFPYQLSDFDLHLMAEGRHYDTYEKLGAHIKTVNGIVGTNFAVWAPSARRVSIVGDFNAWDGRIHPMRPRGSSGIWELFLPNVNEGAIYKYEITGPNENLLPLKSDPYAFRSELRPNTGSVVANLETYTWNDSNWLAAREKKNWLDSPVSVYEVHLGSWRRVPEDKNRWLTYHELADQLIPYVKEMGYTHIELLPVMEHPFDGSWGYQTLGYFVATSRYGTPAQFMEFVDRAHQAGIGVILDWTPAHFPRDAHGLAHFDGTHLYEHADPRLGAHPDWGTLVYNYGRNEVQNYLISNALFWLDKYHIDGLRVDAVASMLYLDYSRKPGEWIPNRYGGRENLHAIDFFKRMNEVAHARFPGVLTIAEESTAWPSVSRPTYLGGLGFSLKWNMGWMNDTLKYFSSNPIYRKYEHNKITFSLIYAFTENFMLPFSHDEVVHGKNSLLHKMPGDMWQQFANLRILLAYQHAHPGKKLLFMGQDFAQRNEWSEERSLDWHLLQYESHKGVQRLVSDLNHLHASEPALHQVDFEWTGFEWIDCNDGDNSVISFIRRARNREDFLVVILNATPVVRGNYRVGVPEPGFYKEILNTDSTNYGGSGVGNLGGLDSEPTQSQERPHTLLLTLPPLSALILKLQR